MKKYISFFRLRFVNGIQYRVAAFAGIVTQFAWGFLEIAAFRAFYESDRAAFPMEFSALCSYIWMQQAFLALFMVWFLENEIFDSITNGNVAYELCRPIDLYDMWYARSIANRLSKGVLRAFPLLIIVFLLPKPYGLVLPKDPATLFWFFFTLLMALCIVVAFCMLIYLATFFTISSQGIRMVSSTVVEFFAGAVIPIPFFPDNVRKVFEILPFGSMQNVPFLIFNGYAKGNQIYRMAAIQIFWLVLLIVLGKRLASAALKKVVVQGG